LPIVTTIIGEERLGLIVAVDLLESGIIDPTEVVHIVLENAVSMVSVPLLTEATLTNPVSLTNDLHE